MPANSCKVTDLQFAMSCLNNMNGSVLNAEAVAQECGMTSASAARQKMDRMKKAHALPSHDQADTKGADKATGKKGAKAMEGTEKGPKKRKIDVVVKEEQAADGGDWLV
ncbi:hypothetical protein B0A50_07658 [Salinomyces thailandicus]|uniref:Myb-like DNA-binding domain-containing protein n=1 Tax=Salinomyces thailandicus TaxID=706561 RepID=A0A4V5N3C1_9PEZI|nr:hypothetical protein B0A50_07658 [Salinomyces thailandica]